MFKMTTEMSKIVQLQRTWLTKCDMSSIPERYYKSCVADLESIKRAIPVRSAGQINILDIGAGMGGVDVLLYQHYSALGVEPHVYLLDKDSVDAKIKYGYSNAPSAYNHVDITDEFLALNSVPIGNRLCTTSYPTTLKFDIVLSLISCGFHYSISEYISFIKSSIHPKTILIFDIRKFSGQFDQLHNVFNWVNCLQITEKYKRVVCRL